MEKPCIYYMYVYSFLSRDLKEENLMCCHALFINLYEFYIRILSLFSSPHFPLKDFLKKKGNGFNDQCVLNFSSFMFYVHI